MSRAFVKEMETAEPPPERLVSEGPNLVTQAGYAQIAARVEQLEAALKDNPGELARETLERDLRYWQVQKASAEIVPPSHEDAVAFGSRVTVVRGGREQTFRIVGEDEADPAHGLVNFRAPLADAVLGAQVGEIVEAGAPLGEIAILKIEN
ncbi:MAG: GreA/GreB family elongation factor [Proteobacteria bacterium]|nr:GreA/GreB family elongation factor [Pseudomonadota bacterium]